MKAWLRGLDVSLQMVQIDEEAVTFRGGTKGSVIDYILYSTNENVSCSKGCVHNVHICDHNGVCAAISFVQRRKVEVLKSVNRFAVVLGSWRMIWTTRSLS